MTYQNNNTMSKVIAPTTLKTLVGKTVEFTDTKANLTDDQLNALYWYCLNTNGEGKLPKLGKKQETQLVEYAMRKALQYNNTHSMRWTIMRDVCISLFGIKRASMIEG